MKIIDHNMNKPAPAYLDDCPVCDSPAMLLRSNDHHGEFFNLGCSNHECTLSELFYTLPMDKEDDAILEWQTRNGKQYE